MMTFCHYVNKKSFDIVQIYWYTGITFLYKLSLEKRIGNMLTSVFLYNVTKRFLADRIVKPLDSFSVEVEEFDTHWHMQTFVKALSSTDFKKLEDKIMSKDQSVRSVEFILFGHGNDRIALHIMVWIKEG